MKIEKFTLLFDKNNVPFFSKCTITHGKNLKITLGSTEPLFSIDLNSGEISFIEPDYITGYIKLKNEYIPIFAAPSIPLDEELAEMIDDLSVKLSQSQCQDIRNIQKELKSYLKGLLSRLEEDTEEITLILTEKKLIFVEESKRYNARKRKGAIEYFLNQTLKEDKKFDQWLDLIYQVFKDEIPLYEARTFVPSEILTKLSI